MWLCNRCRGRTGALGLAAVCLYCVFTRACLERVPPAVLSPVSDKRAAALPPRPVAPPSRPVERRVSVLAGVCL